MHVLVTRPLEDGRTTAARLKAMGHCAVLAPLLEIHYRDGAPIDLDRVQAIAITSANGVRALARRTADRTVPLFAVGAQSAQAAREAGFVRVTSADGDASALADRIAQTLDPEAGIVFHAAGSRTGGALSGRLQARGFSLRSEILYDAVAAPALPADADTALREDGLDAALFYSPRTARIFCSCVKAAHLVQACRSLIAICISPAAACACAALPFAAVRAAAQPNEDRLLGLLGR
jgi:uroporphyrinogen-III synthase